MLMSWQEVIRTIRVETRIANMTRKNSTERARVLAGLRAARSTIMAIPAARHVHTLWRIDLLSPLVQLSLRRRWRLRVLRTAVLKELGLSPTYLSVTRDGLTESFAKLSSMKPVRIHTSRSVITPCKPHPSKSTQSTP